MTEVPHSSRAHSKLGPSAAHRWMECAGSVAASEAYPNKSTVFALEGTAAHEFNEFIMSTGRDPDDWLGGVVDLEATSKGSMFLAKPVEEIDRERFFEIDDEMIEGCKLAQSVVAEYYCPEEGDVLLLETRLDMSWVHPKLFGTGDILIYKKKTKHLIVPDYKYGKGYAVDVEDNPQVLTYAVGARKMFEKQGVDKVTSVIIQPRAFHVDGPVRKETIDSIDLDIFEGILSQRAAATDAAGAELRAGHHCRFCPAAPGCEKIEAHVKAELLGLPFDGTEELTEAGMPEVTSLSSERLGRIVREVTVIEGWLKRVMQYAHAEALEGRVPDGCKLVEKRAYRKFTISEADIEALLDLEGFTTDQIYNEPKMLTLAQIEKVTGKKKFAEVFGDEDSETKSWKKESNGYVLASSDDRRSAVKVDKSDAFGAVED